MKRLIQFFALLLATVMLCALGGCHTPPTGDSGGAHTCQSICADCGKCEDYACEKSVCHSKCLCYESSAGAGYGYFPIIESKMPSIHISTADGSNDWATKYTRGSKLAGLIDYVNATITTAHCESEQVLNGAAAEVKVRGNYTLDYEKKPIRIKFKEETNLLGLHGGEEYKNWVLLADYKDLSLMNNSIAFYLGNTVLGSDGYYCTDFRHVEVYLNGTYWGVYLLVEQQEAKGGRGGVPAVPKNYTGNDIGYFFEYDAYYDLENAMPDGDPTFTMNYLGYDAGSQGYTVKSDINASTQLDFLKSHMDNVFYILYQATVHDTYYKCTPDDGGILPAPEYTSAKEAIGAVIDLASLVDAYILNEIVCDLDVDWSSFYLSLDMTEEGNKKVTFEAPWDFDSSFGSIKKRGSSPDELYAAVSANPWFAFVVGEDWFDGMVREKWAEMKESDVMDGALRLIEIEKDHYRDYYIKNHQRWPSRVLYGNGEVVDRLNTYTDVQTAQGLAADFLKDWLLRRFAYLDGLWGR